MRTSAGSDSVVVYLRDVKAMKKLPAAYHVELQDDWLSQMRQKYGNNNVKVVERVLKSL